MTHNETKVITAHVSFKQIHFDGFLSRLTSIYSQHSSHTN